MIMNPRAVDDTVAVIKEIKSEIDINILCIEQSIIYEG